MSTHYGGSHFASNHYLSNHYGPVVEEAPARDRTLGGWRRERDRWREQILQEDEELLELLTILLHAMG